MLTRIFGLHGTGKTTKIYALLEECINQKKQCYLIVPEQYALSAERTLIEKLGNPANMFVEVINFKRLCNRVFREYGGIVTRTPDDATEQLAMCHVLSQIGDNLHEYSRISSNTDFAANMLSVVKQMHMARIFSEHILKISDKITDQSLKNKLHDLVLAYEAYSGYMENTLEFPGDILDKLLEVLSEFDFFKNKVVFLDSFYGYTAQEIAIIEKIIRTADATYATFLCNGENDDDPIFLRGTRAAAAFKGITNKYGIELKDIHLDSSLKYTDEGLAAIAGNFSVNALLSTNKYPSSDGIKIIECDDLYSEVKCAVTTVANLIVDGVKPREIAICASSTEEYEGIIDEEFEKAGIPFSFDKHEDLSSSPITALVCSAFEAALSFTTQSIIDYIKTGLSGLEDYAADRLEIYMRTWKISGKRYFSENWLMNPDGFVEEEPDIQKIEDVNNSRELILSCLEPFGNAIKNAVTANDFARAVYTLTKDIARLNNAEVIDDGAGGVQLDLLYRTLDNISMTIGDEKINSTRFLELFRSCIKSMKTGRLPEIIDNIRFSSVDLMRTDGINYVIVLGVNDGIFPKKSSSSGIFKDAESKQLKSLGIELYETSKDNTYDELFLAYCALCSAKNTAFVLYRKQDLNNKAMYKSIIILILEKMFGNDIVTAYTEEKVLDHAISDDTLFDYYITTNDPVEKSTLKAYFSEKPEFKAKLQLYSTTDMTNNPLSKNVVDSLYGEKIITSYSRIEKYRECPFKHFCTYTLKLSAEPTATLGSIEAGNVVHKILEELIPEFVKMNEKNEEITPEYIKKRVTEKLDDILQRFMHGNAYISEKFRYMFSKLKHSLNSLCLLIADELKESRFVPADYELKLSYEGGDVPPVEKLLSDGRRLIITGAIDRVDIYKDPQTGESWVRIIDYKTGSKKFDVADALDGFNQQMLLYLYALTSKATDKYGELKPAGIIYRMVLPPGNPNGDFEKATNADFIEAESVSTMSGIVVSDVDRKLIYAMEPKFNKKGRYIPFSESKDKTHGGIDYDNFVKLLKDCVDKAGELAEEIASGQKGMRPVKSGTHDGCKHCDYTDICSYRDKE